MSNFTPYPLKFRPILHERIWGGHYLARMFNIDDTHPIGEAWTLSDHPGSPSICVNGPLSGLSLSEIIGRHPEAYLGSPGSGQFPLLIKFIDAAADLSVQAHPDDQLAQELENQSGKTESWFVLDTHAAGEVVLGHSFRDSAEVEKAALDGTIGDFIKRWRIKTGDVIHIPSGTVHALLAGSQVVEIQQTSDVTYRLFDWNRLGQDGRPRQLHVAKAARAINYAANLEEDRQLKPPFEGGGVMQRQLVDCPYYSMQELILLAEAPLCPTLSSPQVLIVTQGSGILQSGEDSYSLYAGDTLLLPKGATDLVLSPAEYLHVLLVTAKGV